MARRCLLHIGMNKAGSTAIQQAFHGLRGADVAYVDLGEANQSRMLALRFLAAPHARFFTSPHPAEQAAEHAAACRQFDAAVAAVEGNAILSGEALSAFRSVEDCRAVVDGLRATFEDVQVLAYVREPGGYIASSFQQRLKVNRPPDGLDALYPNYRRRLGRWRRAAGSHALTLVPFHPSAFRSGDLLLDFAHRAGVPEAWVQRHAGQVRANPSLSAEATAVLVRLRQNIGAAPLHGPGRQANIALMDALQSFGTTRFRFDPKAVARVLRSNADDIAWIEARMGQPFPSNPPQPGAMVFDGPVGLATYGATLTHVLTSWMTEAFPDHPPRGATVEAMLSNLLADLTAAA